MKGADQMKAEIYKYGPLSCAMVLTETLKKSYQGEIYKEKLEDAESQLNHEVSVVGYKVDKVTGNEYWVVRNTLGTNWGDMGFLYIQMHADNLGIETECISGIPTFTKPAANGISQTEFIQ